MRLTLDLLLEDLGVESDLYDLRLMHRHRYGKVGGCLLGLKLKLPLHGVLLCFLVELPVRLVGFLCLRISLPVHLIELVVETLRRLSQPIPFPAQILDGQGIHASLHLGLGQLPANSGELFGQLLQPPRFLGAAVLPPVPCEM